MELRECVEQMRRNSIILEFEGAGDNQPGRTRFGGRPDVPPDFVWPRYEGKGMDGTVRARALTFLAQFDCKELAGYDSEGLLPGRGVLSFFYEADSQRWGFDPEDAGCARVFWFEDASILIPAEFPADMHEDFQLPLIHVMFRQEASLPGWEDFSEKWPDADDEKFDEVMEALGIEEPDVCSRLLGWPNVIQNSMAAECELVGQGYYLGGSWETVPKETFRQAEETSLENWRLLLQLDMVENGDFCLMFGDGGRIYFYIRREDLLARRFDRVWLILQCG